jgi:hypothetical protein
MVAVVGLPRGLRRGEHLIARTLGLSLDPENLLHLQILGHGPIISKRGNQIQHRLRSAAPRVELMDEPAESSPVPKKERSR